MGTAVGFTLTELDLAARLLETAQRALPGAEIEATVDRNRLSLTRFANSVIHQNVGEDTTTVGLRVHADGRTTAGSSTALDDAGMAALVERTVLAVRVAPLDPGWPGLAPSAEPGAAAAIDEATANATPADRAGVVRAFVDAAGGLETAGYCLTNHWSGAFANSAGQAVAGESAQCGFDGIARRPWHGGIADGVARHAPLRFAELDGAALGARAATKANAAVDPFELAPERYEVVLEPTAVADLLQSLVAFGFNGKTVNDGRSCVRVGEAQFDSAITIVDDPLAVGLGYDTEGSPRQSLLLVDAGTTVAVTHDRRTAAEAGTVSSGHALGGGPFGPVAIHAGFDSPGRAEAPPGAEVEGPAADASVAALVAGVERGVLVTDLWYTRTLDPRQLSVTGLTRNGVWLIEHGEVTRPLRNFRFTQSYAQALMPGAVLGVGDTVSPLLGDTYSAGSPRWSTPALHLASWNFTGGASG